MKIAYITMQYPVPSEAFASVEINEVKSQGHDISIFSLRRKNKLHKKLMKERHVNDLSTYSFDINSLLLFFKYIVFHPLALAVFFIWVSRCNYKKPMHLLKSYILIPSAVSCFLRVKKYKPDVVHMFWGHYPVMVGYLVKKHMINTKTSMFLGAHDLRIGYVGSRYFSRQADYCFTHNYKNFDLLERNGIDSKLFELVYRGIKINYHKQYIKKAPMEKITILSAGRLIRSKGVYETLKIFSLCEMNGKTFHMYIAGDGEEKENIQKWIREHNINNVTLLGHVSQEQLFLYMENAHFFITMSHEDHLPNVLKEAMINKCVVISSDTTGIDELIDHGVSGFIVPHNNYLKSIDYLKETILNPYKYTQISESGYQSVLLKFDVKKSVSHYLEKWSN